MLPETADVMIIGSGPAGLSAAIELKSLGIRNVIVADREPEAGGMPRLCHHIGFGMADLLRITSGPNYASYYREKARSLEAKIFQNTTITGWKNDLTVEFSCPSGLGKSQAGAILLATGVRERPRSARLIPGTRPQGIFTTGSLQRFAYESNLPIGKRAVIIGAELVSLSASLTLLQGRTEVVAMITDQPQHQIYFPFSPMKWALMDFFSHTALKTDHVVSEIFGQKRVEAIEIKNIITGQKDVIECDAVVFTGDWIPEHEIARNGGLLIDSGTKGPQIDQDFRTTTSGVFAAGNLLRGVVRADGCALEGRLAARSIARFLSSKKWTEEKIEIKAENPLIWVCPNIVSPVQSKMSDKFKFRSREFRTNASVQVLQGETTLHQQFFRRLIVNDIMHFDSNWVKNVDFDGPSLRINLLS